MTYHYTHCRWGSPLPIYTGPSGSVTVVRHHLPLPLPACLVYRPCNCLQIPHTRYPQLPRAHYLPALCLLVPRPTTCSGFHNITVCQLHLPHTLHTITCLRAYLAPLQVLPHRYTYTPRLTIHCAALTASITTLPRFLTCLRLQLYLVTTCHIHTTSTVTAVLTLLPCPDLACLPADCLPTHNLYTCPGYLFPPRCARGLPGVVPPFDGCLTRYTTTFTALPARYSTAFWLPGPGDRTVGDYLHVYYCDPHYVTTA